MEIRHIVVLCLENRSFDHMLGWSGIPDLDGLTGAEFNHADPADHGSVRHAVTRNAGFSINPDPGHELHDVTLQLFGKSVPPQRPSANNSGFVKSYEGLTGPGPAAGRIMDAFEPSRLPVLHQLAREFVVCDRWFCSVPGPTWPNRFFLHAASSDGQASNKIMHAYAMKTLYDALEEAERDWRIYYHDIPQSLALTGLRTLVRRRKFRRIGGFYDDVNAGRLTSFSFIEPRYFNIGRWRANDQHSDHDVRFGEDLIADVYAALRANPAIWERCLFIITYDEHGGLYDHVSPPFDGEHGTPVPNPDGQTDPQSGFSFTRLGPRVPTLFISPWVGKGIPDHAVYEHSSIAGGVRQLFAIPRPLTRRDQAARPAVPKWLSAPRTDTPVALDRPQMDAVPLIDDESAAPINDLQRTLIELARQVDPEPLVADAVVATWNEAVGGRYVSGVMERITGEASGE